MTDIKEILAQLGIKGEAEPTDEEKSRQYALEYGLLNPPSNYEIRQIEATKRQRSYCERCSGLMECQYKNSNYGLEAVIIVNDINGRLRGNRLYFGVKECRHLVKEKEARKIEELRQASGLPEQYKEKTRYDLEEEPREALKGFLNGEMKQLYISCEYHKQREVLSIIGNESLRAGLETGYVNVLEILSELRVTSPTYHERMKRVKEVEVLIMSGLPRGMSQYNDEQIGIILEARNRRGKRTVVSGEARKREMRGISGAEMSKYREFRIPNS